MVNEISNILAGIDDSLTVIVNKVIALEKRVEILEKRSPVDKLRPCTVNGINVGDTAYCWSYKYNKVEEFKVVYIHNGACSAILNDTLVLRCVNRVSKNSNAEYLEAKSDNIFEAAHGDIV